MEPKDAARLLLKTLLEGRVPEQGTPYLTVEECGGVSLDVDEEAIVDLFARALVSYAGATRERIVSWAEHCKMPPASVVDTRMIHRTAAWNDAMAYVGENLPAVLRDFPRDPDLEARIRALVGVAKAADEHLHAGTSRRCCVSDVCRLLARLDGVYPDWKEWA